MKAGSVATSLGVVVLVIVLFLPGCSDDNPVDSDLVLMNVSPAKVSMEVPFGGAITHMPAIEVRASESAQIPFTATKTADWISLVGATGTTPDIITANLSSEGLIEGLYVDSIMVTSESASNSPQYVLIEWTVTPTLRISPSRITYWVSSDDSLRDTTLTIESAGSAALTFEATESSAWFDLATASGATPGTLTIQYSDLSAFAITQIVEEINIYSPEVDKNYTVPITLNITKWTALDQSGVIQDDLKGISFSDDLHGWAVAVRGGGLEAPNAGIIFRTIDGGENWVETHQFSAPDINLGLGDVFFVDHREGWVVGRDGLVRRSRDGGTSWDPKRLLYLDTVSIEPLIIDTLIVNSLGIQSVYFISQFTGWVAGDRGLVYYTTNAGTVWKKATPVTDQVLSSIFFADASNGWAVGNGGVILSSIDGGKTWAERLYGGTDFRGVSFAGSKNGWVVGENGTIMATTDGGATWKLQPSPVTGWLSDVIFVNSSRGWAVGENGAILFTDDSGETWVDQSLGGSNPPWLHSVDFINSSKGWIAGDNGTVYVGEFAP